MTQFGTFTATMKQIPVVVEVIGGLVRRPEPDSATFDEVGRLVALGSDKQRWALLDAALTVTTTLRDALVEMTGAPGLLFSEDGLVWPEDIPENFHQGGRDAFRILAAPSGTVPAALIKSYRSGEVSPEHFLGAVTVACHCGFLVVQAIAGVSQTPMRKTWKQIAPFLLEP